MRASTILCLALAVAAIGCKKKKEEADPPSIPVDTAPTPVVVASEAPPADSVPAASSSAPGAATAPPAATTAPPSGAQQPGTAPAKKESIDDCCAALRAYKSSGRPKAIKDKAANAARVCSAVSPVVKDGRTSRQAALVQVRAALQGAEGPPECR